MPEEKGNQSVTQRNEITEVIDANGRTLQSSASLGSIFDKIESGAAAKDAIKEVMSAKPVTQEANEDVKKEGQETETPEQTEEASEEVTEEVTEVQEEPAAEVAGLDAALDNKQAKKDAAAAKETEVEVVKKEESEAISDDELKVLPHDRPKTAKRISALLQKVREADEIVATTKKEVEAKAAKLAELETELAKTKSVDPVTNEAIKGQLEELSMLRRQYELDKDPEVKTKFDGRLESAEESITGILKKFNAGEGLLAIVKEEGGWAQFCDSRRVIKLSDGQELPASEVAELIVQTLPYGSRRAIEAATIEQSQTVREKQRYFEEQKRTASEFFKKREEANALSQKEQADRVAAASTEIINWKKDVLENTDWLKVKPVPATATEDQKASIAAQNQTAVELQERIEQTLSGGNSMKHLLSVVKDAVSFHYANKQLAQKDAVIKAQEAKIKELEAKNDAVKKAGSAVPKKGSISSGGGVTLQVQKSKIPQGLEAALSILESGGKIGDEE